MKYKCLIFSVANQVSIRSLGANRIAHVLREQGWDAEVIEWAAIWNLSQLQALAKSRISSDTKFIGISSLFSYVWSDVFEQFLVWVKQEYPDIVIIAGGQQEIEANTKSIDYYIRGFGEYALLDLLKYLFSNGPRPKFELLTTNNRKVINATLSYPAYPMSSYMVKYESRDFIHPGETLGIEFARGCKFSCSYCNFPVLGVKGDYSRDANDAAEQLTDTYDRFGVSKYIISDETFNDRTEKITKFADVVEALPFTPWFSAYLRSDLLISRPRDKEELLRMNVVNHFYGIESFCHTAAKAVGKGMATEKLKQGLLDLRQYYESRTDYFRCMLSFIVGLPHETIESINSTRQWLRDHWQGQSVEIHALWIPINAQDNKSRLSFDYKKYGYSEIESPAVVTDRTERGERISAMQWQNEHMDIHIASTIESEWIAERELANSPFKIGFNELCDPRLSDLPLNEIYSMNPNDKTKQVRSKFGFVDTYIDKKLNCNG